MNKICSKDLTALSLGSVFLATGGGGDPYLPMLLAKQALEEWGPVDLITVADINDNAYIAAIGAVGAPTVSLELLPSIDEAPETLNAFESYVGKSVDLLASFEIGGGNSLLPIIAAAKKGIPIIDGDGMGRALPEAQMMTYAIAGAKPTPAVARDYAGNLAKFESSSTEIYERHIRSFAMAAGGMIVAVEHPMSGAFIKTAIIPGTVSFAIKLGQVLTLQRGNVEQIMPHLQALFSNSMYGDCKLLFTGKVVDKSTKIIGGYDIGNAVIEGFGSSKKQLSIAIKNEYLLALLQETVLASVPDLIIVVDYETSAPINAERLKYGQRVGVISVGCPEFYRLPESLKVVSPRAFGFDIDYKPIS